MMVKWCGNCAVGARNCDNTRYMECTSKPFKLWEPNSAATAMLSFYSKELIDAVNEGHDDIVKRILGKPSEPPKSEGNDAKWDGGKLELDLVPLQIVSDIAEVRMYGTRKYGDPENWRKVELRRYVNAMLRHMVEFVRDYDSVDKESGIPHYKHMECNMAFISEMMRARREGNHVGEV